MTRPLNTFAARLRSLREGAGLSVEQLAVHAGLSRQNLYRLESGDRQPALATAQKLCAALGLSLAAFDDCAAL